MNQLNKTTTATTSLNLPRQASPVERTHAGAVAVREAGATASFGWGDLLSIATKVLPTVLGAI